MVNVFAKDGTYMMMKWSHMLMTMETSNQTFVVGGWENNDLFSLSEFNALNISINTRVDIAIVLGRRSLKDSHASPMHREALVSSAHVICGPPGYDINHHPNDPTVAMPT